MILHFVNRERWRNMAKERVLLPGSMCSLGMGATSPVSATCSINGFASVCSFSASSTPSGQHLTPAPTSDTLPHEQLSPALWGWISSKLQGEDFQQVPLKQHDSNLFACQWDTAVPSPTRSGSQVGRWECLDLSWVLYISPRSIAPYTHTSCIPQDCLLLAGHSHVTPISCYR